MIALDEGTRGRSGMVGVQLDVGSEIEGLLAPFGYHSGVTVAAVTDAGPAAVAGVRPGDVIVAIRGRRYDELAADMNGRFEFARLFGETIRGLLAGETVAVTVVRPGGEPGTETGGGAGVEETGVDGAGVIELELTVAAAGVEEQARIDSAELLGLQLAAEGTAPVVSGLMPGSPIFGIRGAAELRGATIISIVGQRVTSLEDLGSRLALLREWIAAGGQLRRISIGFRSADGKELQTAAYPLWTH